MWIILATNESIVFVDVSIDIGFDSGLHWLANMTNGFLSERPLQSKWAISFPPGPIWTLSNRSPYAQYYYNTDYKVLHS